jgi:hypothetical protein
MFTIVFSMELVLKNIVLGRQFFIGPDWLWNMFDLFLVSTMVADQFGLHAHVAMLRLLRLLRITRMTRLLRFIHELRIIVLSIAASVMSLFWSLMLLVMMIYAASVLSVEVLLMRMDSMRAAGLDEEMSDDLSYWFRSLSRTMLTLFECIAGGVSWDEPANVLIEEVSVTAGICLCLFVAFCMFAIMNVITGVVLDTATNFARKEEDRTMANKIASAFQLSLTDTEREINWEDFERSSKTGEMRSYLNELDVGGSDSKMVFNLIDSDGSGGLNPSELITGLMKLRGGAKAVDVALLFQRQMQIQEWMVGQDKRLEGLVTQLLLGVSDLE